MAFLPALVTRAQNVTKRQKQKQQEGGDKRGYRVSFSQLDEANTKCDPPTTQSTRHAKPPEHGILKQDRSKCTATNNNIWIDINSRQPKPRRLQSLEKPKPILPEPRMQKHQDSVASEKCMFQWLEPLGLWIPINQDRRFYQKFSNRMDLCYKGPDDLMDPCPHIPRCDHARSWSTVKMERQKFRELKRLRNELSSCRTIERYRNMQDLWLQQMEIARDALQDASSQERIERFRRAAGENVVPINESQRIARLQKRRQEWEETWRRRSERRNKNPTKKKVCLFPHIIITDHDEDIDDNVFDGIQDINTACREHVRICGEHVIPCEEHVRICGGHVIPCEEHVRICGGHVIPCEQHVRICGGHVIRCGEHVRICGGHVIPCEEHVRICGGHVIPCEEHVRICGGHVIRCGEHVTTYGQHVTLSTSDDLYDKYDIQFTLAQCCSKFSRNSRTVEYDKNMVVVQKADYVEERVGEFKRDESIAIIRKTPSVKESGKGLHPRRTMPKDVDKSSRVSECTQNSSQDVRRLIPRGSDPTESLSNSQIKDPSMLSSLSSSETGQESSVSIMNNLTDISTAGLFGNIRQADNTAQLMGRLMPVPLGMTSGEIPDESITSSSAFDIYHNANQARFHNEKKDENGGAWIPRLRDNNPYLEIDLGNVITIQQVATQGNPASAVKREKHKRWVTMFSLEFSEDGKTWREYEESGRVKEFTGNSDLDTVVINSLESPVETRFVRFRPKEWHNGIAMRVEIFGQKPLLPESDQDDKIMTELKQRSPDLSGSCVEEKGIKNETDDGLEQLFAGNEVDPGNEEFCVLGERVVTPAILQSPVPSLVSPRALCIKQKDWQEATFCVNNLPTSNATTKQIEQHDQEQKEPNVNDESLVNKEPKNELESHRTIPQHSDVDQQVISEAEDLPAVLEPSESGMNNSSRATDEESRATDEESRALESNAKRYLIRAQTDGSIERQLRREKMADERRKRLASLNSQNLRRSDEVIAPTEMIEKIDELGSYLEKYCIIGKSEAIVYKKVFEQFDKDEDGFLWPEEVLEALEKVNTNLLKDSHLSYVFRILEQCDCQVESGTGLRLFTVVAALSQRVAALNKKMKILISKCDFKTIDGTLLRAKMLFECYVDEHTNRISRGDLWVGLAAGGLWTGDETMEDCFEGRQYFDFLDFLTHLPLFQVIHGYVIDNPLTAF